MSDASNPLRVEAVGVLRNSRRRYDPASKRRLVEACLQPGVSLAGVALRHGVNANLLRKWVKEFGSDPAQAFPGHGQMKPEQQEIERLRREVARLKAERDILKKAAAFFANETP